MLHAKLWLKASRVANDNESFWLKRYTNAAACEKSNSIVLVINTASEISEESFVIGLLAINLHTSANQ